MKWFDEFISAAEESEWQVVMGEDHAEFGKFSSAGRDFWVEVTATSPGKLLEDMRFQFLNRYHQKDTPFLSGCSSSGFQFLNRYHQKFGRPTNTNRVYF